MSIRTTVIGSYPKVTASGADNLPGTLDKWQRQLVDDRGLEQELQRVTQRVIREQEEARLDLVTDGQIRWEDLPHPVARSTRGIQRGALRRFFDNNVYYRRLELNGGVSWQKSAAAEDFQLASQWAKKPLKVALPGPLTLVNSTELKAGQTRESLLELYEGFVRKEVQALAEAGVKEIQLDEPALGPGEPLLDQTVSAVNRIFQGVRARRWLACYFQDVTAVLPALAKLQVEVLALDLVSPQEKVKDFLSKAAARLKEVGWGGEVALGLVDARNTRLESREDLKRQIGLFAEAIPVSRLWLSPNCGLEFLPHDRALKKLKLLKEAAQDHESSHDSRKGG